MVEGRKKPRWLLFGIGNPSRGDDALGGLFAERLGARDDLRVEWRVETDFQLMPEHALDLQGVAGAIFADASVDLSQDFGVTRLVPSVGLAHTSHALPPADLLAVAVKLGQVPPPCWQVVIRGVDFDLGCPPSEAGLAALEVAVDACAQALHRDGTPYFI